MPTLFPPSHFDDWADSYDKEVSFDSGFPFYGYANVLKTILDLSAAGKGDSVLDLGIGTGNLASLFAKRGCVIWGLDFSGPMLEKARVKLPNAILGQTNIAGYWPATFQRRYDRIISAYTFHHFPMEEKVKLVGRLLNENLIPNGRLIIGDIAFKNAKDEDDLRRPMGDEWEQEYYWLADETILELQAIEITVHFTKISSCAGVFHFNLQN